MRNWIGDTFENKPGQDTQVSMKPAIASLLNEAFKIAVCDCLPDIDDARRIKISCDIYQITEKEWMSIDPGALSQNIMVRMFGIGGFTVRGVYAGNATPQQNFDACVANKDQSDVDNFIGEFR